MSKYATNSAWLITDQSIVLLFNLVVTAVVARYLGPSGFGILSYTFALAAIFGTFGRLGLDGLVVRELAQSPDDEGAVLGTAFCIKFMAYLLAAAGLVAFAQWSAGNDTERRLLWIGSLLLVCTPFLTTNSWFQAHVKGRSQALANTGGHLVSGITKLAAASSSLSIIVFAIANTLQVVVTALVASLLYLRQSSISFVSWRFSKKVARRLLSEGWVIFLAALLSAVYLKIDLAMLKWLSTPEVVGIYAVAAKLSEASYFVSGALMTSVFPRLIGLKDEGEERFKAGLQVMFDIMALVAFVIVVVVIIGAPFAIPLIFGTAYSEAGLVLVVHIMALPLIFVRTVFTRWILIDRFPKFLLISDGAGAFANIGLNFLIIPHWGALGAAVATILSYLIASYLALVFHQRTRPLFFMMTQSLFLPWRAIGRIRLHLI